MFGLHSQVEKGTVCSSQCLGCTDRNRNCVYLTTFWLHRQVENRHCVFITMFGLHRQVETGTVCSPQCLGCTDRQKQTLCVHHNVWVAQTDRQKQTLFVHHNVWVAQTNRNRHCVFITMFGLHRQTETDTVCSSQCLGCTDR